MRSISHVRRYGSVAATVLSVGLFTPAQASAQFSNVFFFGDSFTDTGNATFLSAANSLPNPTPAPYFPGHFSNGPVWTEYFAAALGLPTAAGPAWIPGGTNNYAVGAATTGLLGGFGSATGMLSQGQLYGTQHPGPVAPSVLFVLWGGGNDILDATQLASPAAQQLAIQQAVTNIATLALALRSNFGAAQFLIPFLPDAGNSPAFVGDPVHAQIATGLSDLFNALLGAALIQINATGANARGLHLDNLVANIRIDAAQGGLKYGITNTTTPCFLNPAPNACASSLFVDGRHPTTAVGQLIAQAAFNRVVLNQDVSLAPEPSSFALAGAGLAVLGIMAKRRRARQSVLPR